MNILTRSAHVSFREIESPLAKGGWRARMSGLLETALAYRKKSMSDMLAMTRPALCNATWYAV